MKQILLNLLGRYTPSKIILNNCVELISREQVGLSKYGVSLTDAPLTHEQALQHLLEEQLDAANYTRKALLTASKAHQDYALLRAQVEQLDHSLAHARPTIPLDSDGMDEGGRQQVLDAYQCGLDEARHAITRMLLQFDVDKCLRDLTP